MIHLYVIFLVLMYFVVLEFFNVIVANCYFIFEVIFICGCLCLAHYKRVSKIHRYRISTDGKKYFIQFLEKRFILIGREVWKDMHNTETNVVVFHELEMAKIKLKSLVEDSFKKEQQNRIKDNKSREHVPVHIDINGTSIPF